MVILCNGCPIRNMFCTIFVSLSVAKILKKHVRSSSYLIQVFLKEDFHSHGKLLNAYFYYSFLTSNFWNRYFSEFLFVASERKENNIYQRKLKPGDRSWALEIAYWKVFLHGQLFCIRQNSQFSQFYRVPLVELCALLINTSEKLHLINSEANLRPPQHLKCSFCDIRLCRHLMSQGDHYRCLKLVTTKILKMYNCKIM